MTHVRDILTAKTSLYVFISHRPQTGQVGRYFPLFLFMTSRSQYLVMCIQVLSSELKCPTLKSAVFLFCFVFIVIVKVSDIFW